MNNVNNMKVTLGAYTIELEEKIMKRLETLSECSYMVDEMGKVINAMIEVYNEKVFDGHILKDIDCMALISVLREAQKDYSFLSTLIVEKNLDDVFDDEEDEA